MNTENVLGSQPPAALQSKRLSVFLLDDNASVLKATTRLLDSAGWSVRSFSDPQLFLHEATRHRPDLAIVDVIMPEMNGLEVQAQLRHLSPTTRIIIFSSKEDPATRTRAVAQGAYAYFLKGSEHREFLAGIEAAARELR